MKKYLLITITILTFAYSANAQTPEPEKICISAAAASDCARAFDEVKASRTAIDALKAENESLRRLDVINTTLLAKKDEIIAGQERLIKLQGKKSSKCFGLSIGPICAGFKY